MSRGQDWWNEPPWWAAVVMAVNRVWARLVADHRAEVAACRHDGSDPMCMDCTRNEVGW